VTHVGEELRLGFGSRLCGLVRLDKLRFDGLAHGDVANHIDKLDWLVAVPDQPWRGLNPDMCAILVHHPVGDRHNARRIAEVNQFRVGATDIGPVLGMDQVRCLASDQLVRLIAGKLACRW
jgi:hypothetical protein